MLDLSVTVPDPAMMAGTRVFSCRRSDAGAIASIAVGGELDLATIAHVDGELRAAQSDAAIVVLDLRELTFIDSAGAQVILNADRRARRAGGRLVVVRGRVAGRLFALLDIERRLELVDRVDLSNVPLPRCWQGRLS